MSFISVAMATYNGSQYLAVQLDSIMAQTLVPDEVLVVDDCSADGTWQILESYAKRYPQIKIYKNKANLGVIQTVERALTLVSGSLIALADQDDYWFPHKLEVLTQKLGGNLLVHSDAYVVDDNLKVIKKSYTKIKAYHDNSLFMYYLRNNVTGCTVMMRRELLLLSLPFPAGIIMHDHYLALCAKFYNRLLYTELKLIKYRQHANNVIGAYDRKTYAVMINDYRKHALFCDALARSAVPFDQAKLVLVKNYFEAMINAKRPSLKTILMIGHYLGYSKIMTLCGYTFFGRMVAKICYRLRHPFI